MKRFVTYLYQYENCLKVKNTGFAKIEVKNGQGRVEIVVIRMHIIKKLMNMQWQKLDVSLSRDFKVGR